MAKKMHLSTNKLPMPSQTNTMYTKSNGSPILSPTPTHTIQFIEFTYCHDRFLGQAITHKHDKYHPLISNIQNKGWHTNPLITITVGVRGAIHEHSITKLINLKIPKSSITNLMKELHQNAIKHLTDLVKRNSKINKLLSHLPK